MSINEQRTAIIKEIGELELRAEKGENVTASIRHCGKRLEALGRQRKRKDVMDVGGFRKVEMEQKQAKAADNELRLKWRQVAGDNGLSNVAYYKRVANGMSYEEAATAPKQVNGSTPNPYVARAVENGIPKRAFYSRLGRGWSQERACVEPLKTTQSAKKKETVK